MYCLAFPPVYLYFHLSLTLVCFEQWKGWKSYGALVLVVRGEKKVFSQLSLAFHKAAWKVCFAVQSVFINLTTLNALDDIMGKHKQSFKADK